MEAVVAYLRQRKSCFAGGRFHPRTGHEFPMGSRGIALLFL